MSFSALGERRLVSTRNSRSIQNASQNCFLEDERRGASIRWLLFPLQNIARGSLPATSELSSGFVGALGEARRQKISCLRWHKLH